MFDYVDWAVPNPGSESWLVIGKPELPELPFGVWIVPENATSHENVVLVHELPLGKTTAIFASGVGIIILSEGSSESYTAWFIAQGRCFEGKSEIVLLVSGLSGDFADLTSQGYFSYVVDSGSSWNVHQKKLFGEPNSRVRQIRRDAGSVLRPYSSPGGRFIALRTTNHMAQSTLDILDSSNQLTSTGITQALDVRWTSDRYVYAIGVHDDSPLSLVRWDTEQRNCRIVRPAAAHQRFLNRDGDLSWITPRSSREFALESLRGQTAIVSGVAPIPILGHCRDDACVMFVDETRGSGLIRGISVDLDRPTATIRFLSLVAGKREQSTHSMSSTLSAYGLRQRSIIRTKSVRPLMVISPDPGPWASIRDQFHRGMQRVCAEKSVNLRYVSAPKKAYLGSDLSVELIQSFISKCRAELPKDQTEIDLVFEGYSGAARLATAAALELGGDVFLRAPISGVDNYLKRISESCPTSSADSVGGIRNIRRATRLMVVHGAQDARIPIGHSMNLVREWENSGMGPTRLVEVADAGHSLEMPDRTAGAVVDAFAQFLSP